MAVAQVGTPAADVQITSTGTLTGQWGSGQNRTVGNVLVAVVCHGGNSGAALPTVSGWTLISANSTSNYAQAGIYYRVATGGDAAWSGSVTVGTGVAAVKLYELSGVNTTTPIDSADTGGVTGTTGTSLTPVTDANIAAAGGWAIAAYGQYKTSSAATCTFTAASGWTNSDKYEASARGHWSIDIKDTAPATGSTCSEAETWSGTTAYSAGTLAVFASDPNASVRPTAVSCAVALTVPSVTTNEPYCFATGADATANSSRQFAVSKATHAGDTLTLIIGVTNNSTTVSSVTDSQNNVWQLDKSYETSGPMLYAYRAAGPDGGPGGLPSAALTTSDTITVTTAPVSGSITIHAVCVPQVGAMDVSAAVTRDTSTTPSISATPAYNNEVCISGFVTQNAGGLPTVNAPFTSLGPYTNGGTYATQAYEFVSGGSGVQQTSTLTIASVYWDATMWTFRRYSPDATATPSVVTCVTSAPAPTVTTVAPVTWRGGNSGNSGTTLVLTHTLPLSTGWTGAAPQAGDLVAYVLRLGTASLTISEDSGTWTRVHSSSLVSGGISWAVFWKVIGPSEPDPTFSWGGVTSARICWAAGAVTPPAGKTLAFDVAGTGDPLQIGGTPPPSNDPTVNPASAADTGEVSLILSCARAYVAATVTSWNYTQPAGWSWADGNGAGFSGNQNFRFAACAYKLNVGSGSVTPGTQNLTDSNSDVWYWGISHLLFKQVTASGDATATPSVVSALVSIPVPGVSTSAQSSATAVSAATNIAVPAIPASPAAIPATISLPVPHISAGLRAMILQAATSLPVPGISAGLTPTALQSAASLPALRISAGLTATAPQAATTLPVPGISAGLTCTAVPAATSIPTPVVSVPGDATTTPATATATITIPAPSLRPAGKVYREGSALYLDGEPFRAIGFNVHSAAITSWNIPPNTSSQINDVLGATLDSMQDGAPQANTIRCWFFQQFALNSTGDSTPSLPYRWDAFDKILTECEARGIKVVACLFDQWNWERNNTNGSIAASWYTGDYATTAQLYEAVPYRQYVSDVVTRYANNPTILAWELINEPNPNGGGSCPPNAGDIMRSLYSDVGGLIKSIDPYTLISTGGSGEVCGQDGADYSALANLSCVDLVSFHDYTGATNAGGTWGGGNGLDDSCTRAVAAGKPLLVGECGIHLSTAPVNGDTSVRASYLDAKLDIAFNTYSNVAGYLPWSYVQAGDSEDYTYASGDPALATLNSYALLGPNATITPNTISAVTSIPAEAPGNHIRWRGGTSGNNGSGSDTSVTPILPAGWAVGDFLAIIVRVGTTAQDITQTAGTGSWTRAWNSSWTTGGYTWAVFTHVMAPGDTAPTFGWSSSGRHCWACGAFYADSGYTLSLDVTGTGDPLQFGTAGTAVTANPATATGDGEASLILTCARATASGSPTSHAFTPPPGWTWADGDNAFYAGGLNARFASVVYRLGQSGTVTPGAGESLTDLPTGDSFYFGAGHVLVKATQTSVTVTPGTVLAATSILTPRISAGLTATTAACITAIPVPSVSASNNASAPPSYFSAATAIPVPTISVALAVSTVPCTTALTQPSVTATNSVSISATSVLCTAALPAASLVAASVLAPAALLALSSIPATRPIAGPAAVLTATSLPGPTASAAARVTASAPSCSTSIPTPSIQSSSAAQASATAIQATATIPALVPAVGSVLSLTAIAGGTQIPSRAPSTGTLLSVTTVPASASANTPSVATQGNIQLNPNAILASTEFPPFTATANSRAAPTAITSTTALPAAPVYTGIAPPTIAAATAIPAPTLVTIRNVAITATAVLATTAIAAQAHCDKTATPTAIAGTSAFYSPTFNWGARPLPAGVTCQATMGHATVLIGWSLLVQPVTIQATVAFYAPGASWPGTSHVEEGKISPHASVTETGCPHSRVIEGGQAPHAD